VSGFNLRLEDEERRQKNCMPRKTKSLLVLAAMLPEPCWNLGRILLEPCNLLLEPLAATLILLFPALVSVPGCDAGTLA